ncbi:hypothetical protein Pfo_031054 [Paulownia fortunei]|nr:hypothetical protein Pfo_031054 [Paulownia fortunei]
MSKARLPCMPPNVKKFLSEDYKKWWTKVHGIHFEENIANLINLKPSKISPKDKEYDENDPLHDSPHMHVISFFKECNTQTIKPLEANKRKNISHPIEESGSSNVDRHWKRPKRNLEDLEPRDIDIHDVTNNPR